MQIFAYKSSPPLSPCNRLRGREGQKGKSQAEREQFRRRVRTSLVWAPSRSAWATRRRPAKTIACRHLASFSGGAQLRKSGKFLAVQHGEDKETIGGSAEEKKMMKEGRLTTG